MLPADSVATGDRTGPTTRVSSLVEMHCQWLLTECMITSCITDRPGRYLTGAMARRQRVTETASLHYSMSAVSCTQSLSLPSTALVSRRIRLPLRLLLLERQASPTQQHLHLTLKVAAGICAYVHTHRLPMLKRKRKKGTVVVGPCLGKVPPSYPCLDGGHAFHRRASTSLIVRALAAEVITLQLRSSIPTQGERSRLASSCRMPRKSQ